MQALGADEIGFDAQHVEQHGGDASPHLAARAGFNQAQLGFGDEVVVAIHLHVIAARTHAAEFFDVGRAQVAKGVAA